MTTVLLLLATLVGPVAAQAPSAAGAWDGTINVGPAPLVIAVRLDQAAAGAWSGTIDITAQGMTGRPLSEVTVDGRTIRFVLAGVPGTPTFVGTLSDDGTTIAGDFTQGPGKLTFALKRRTGAEPPPPRRPQTPQAPFPYDVADVTVRNESAGVTLAGTLTTPRTPGPHRVVVLITGSNAQDRDSTLFGHKPFLVLADHLTRRGTAVLRLDDRGVGGSSMGSGPPTSEDFASDIAAAVDFLRARPGIDAARIGLIGHSEGGIIAPMVALRSKSVSFLVLMAGPGVTGEEILYQQVAAIGRASNLSDAQMASTRALQERLYTVLKTEKDVATMQARIREINGEESARILTQPWFRFFVTYDPATALRKIVLPTLALGGENDLQVPAKQNLAAIEAALRAGGNTQFTIRSFPALNHLLQTSRTGLPAEYAELEETIAPVVLEAIADWVGRR